MVKITTRDLVAEHIECEVEMSLTTDNEEQLNLESEMVEIQTQIRDKVDGIDHFMVELSRKEYLIDAEIESIKNEQTRLRVRQKAVVSLKDYFNKTLLPMVVSELGDSNGVYETDTARYKMYETFGPVAVADERLIPDEYIKKEYVESVDKKKARKDLTAGVAIPGFFIEKVKRVRRS